MWEISLTKRALKDAKKITRAGLKSKVDQLINVLKTNPYQNPPSYEKLTGDLADMYSRRINIQHRLNPPILWDFQAFPSNLGG
jgi:Txe/YoeB family toxin of toxin-antitoxin system